MRDKLDKGKVTYEEYVEWLNGIQKSKEVKNEFSRNETISRYVI